MVARAQGAFGRTMAALGSPEPAISPDADLLEPMADAVVGKAGDGAAKRLQKLVPSGP
jgi:hypothetical protein